MGTWGHGHLDNDAAGDLEVVWNEYVVRGREADPERWTPERIVGFFRTTYFRSPFRGDNAYGIDLDGGETAVEVLALGALFQRHDIPIPPPFRDLLARAANAELRKEKLKEWDSPRKRQRVLVAFLESIGAEREDVVPTDPLREEVARLREFSKRIPQFLDHVRTLRRPTEEEERLWPDFIDRLGETMGKGTRASDPKLEAAAYQHRLVVLAFCVGWWLKLSDQETLALIDRAKATRGEVSALWGLRGRG